MNKKIILIYLLTLLIVFATIDFTQGQTIEGIIKINDMGEGYARYRLPSGSTSVYPLVTHFTYDNGGPQGHYDPYGKDPDRAHYRGTPNFIEPTYENYNNEVTEAFAPTPEEIIQRITDIENATGFLVDNYNDFELKNIKENIDRIQIVNLIRIGDSLFTIILPPYWSKQKLYPVLLTGNGGGHTNYGRLYSERTKDKHSDDTLPELAGWSVKDGGSGLIIVIGNTGGQGSVGSSEQALKDVANMLISLKDYGGDRYRVINYGASRGGWTALVWGANPKNYDYKSIAIFADSAPAFGGKMIMTPFANVSGAWYDCYEKDSWRYDHIPPPLNPPIKALEGLFGTGDPKVVDATISPGGMIEKFRGKYLNFDWGSHDYDIYPSSILFDQLLTKAGIPHNSQFVLKGSHEATISSFLNLKDYLDDLLHNKPSKVKNQREFHIQKDLQTHNSSQTEFLYAVPNDENISFPFTAILPLRVGLEIPGYGQEPAFLEVSGTKGKPWKVEMHIEENNNRKLIKTFEGTFGVDSINDEFDIIDLTFPKIGTYYWKFYYDREEISPFNTAAANGDGIPYEAVTFAQKDQINNYNDYGFYVGERVLSGIAKIPTCGNNICEEKFTENKYTCPNDCVIASCVSEGESLGAVYPGNNAQCCPGLVPYIPPEMLGTRGICVKSSTTKKGGLNNDSKVDIVDLGILLSNWGKTTKPPSDINQDGKVDVIDLGILLSNWG